MEALEKLTDLFDMVIKGYYFLETYKGYERNSYTKGDVILYSIDTPYFEDKVFLEKEITFWKGEYTCYLLVSRYPFEISFHRTYINDGLEREYFTEKAKKIKDKRKFLELVEFYIVQNKHFRKSLENIDFDNFYEKAVELSELIF